MNLYCLAPLFLFSLWDYYIPSFGGRIFDYMGLILIFLYFVFNFNVGREALRRNRGYPLVILAMLPSVLAGYFQGEWLAATAFLVGAVLVYGFYSALSYSNDKLYGQVGFLILIELSFFFFQYVAYKFWGVIVDYHSYFGALNPRVFNEETGYFRAAGLFQEPNSFCLMIYMLNSIRIVLKPKKPDLLFLTSLAAIFLSESLWGFGAILLLILVVAGLFKLTVTRFVLLLSVAGLVSLVALRFDNLVDILSSVIDPITMGRIVDIGNDPSRKARFGEGDIIFDGYLLFGRGLSTELFQSFLGANAIGFYVYSFGIFGLLLFFGWIVVSSSENKIRVAVVVLFAMSSYPLFTYGFWWAWLAILILLGNAQYESTSLKTIRD